ncbi:hypothetical protein VP1G_03788 [Cytospora mali]|uniref:Uncharacterized protein n=1 Tax=Cytospora mali TaxID=578113 RepID=A0A194UXN7_CYTMA|nr:hypothetical protein VP1G_03788 [Valsa mali var. pyri (nom. inval.)]
MDTLPGPRETIVSTAHGNAALSDAAHPVTIAHHSQGAVLTPPSPPRSSSSSSVYPESSMVASVVGKVHFPLPTLRAPEEETPRGSLAAGYAIVSTALEVAVAPYPHQDGQLALHVGSKITRAEVFAGRELLWSSYKGGDDDDLDSQPREDHFQQQQQQGPLPAGRDFRLHIESVIYCDESNGGWFNENTRGLGVTLTVQFYGERPGLIVSSVALVQMMGSRKLRS